MCTLKLHLSVFLHWQWVTWLLIMWKMLFVVKSPVTVSYPALLLSLCPSFLPSLFAVSFWYTNISFCFRHCPEAGLKIWLATSWYFCMTGYLLSERRDWSNYFWICIVFSLAYFWTYTISFCGLKELSIKDLYFICLVPLLCCDR